MHLCNRQPLQQFEGKENNFFSERHEEFYGRKRTVKNLINKLYRTKYQYTVKQKQNQFTRTWCVHIQLKYNTLSQASSILFRVLFLTSEKLFTIITKLNASKLI